MTIEVENRTFSGEAAKFQSSDHQTAPIHASLITRRGFPCHSFLTGLALRADPCCEITRRSRKATVTTPVSQLGRTGNIWFFSWREEGSHSRTQTAAESRWNSQEYSEVWLLLQRPEAAVISCWLWRRYPMAGAPLWRRLRHVTSGGNQNNLTTCVYTWGMCSKSMWCQVQFTTRIVTDHGS